MAPKERKDIGAGVNLHSLRLLGRHVGRCAKDVALLAAGLLVIADRQRQPVGGARSRCRMGVGDILHQLGQAEIGNLHQPLVRHHNVRRLEVPVDDTGRVGLGQAVGDLDSLAERFGEPQPFVPDQVIKGFSLHILHEHEIAASSSRRRRYRG